MSMFSQTNVDKLTDPSQGLPPAEPSSLVLASEDDKEPKNRKWSDHQHILYILFLEENREKTKSKLIRRSNSFYKEMSTFIGSKTGVQCRSHHQKYEGKYKYPHRIIKEEKQRFDTSLYLEVKQTIPKRPLTVEEKEENSISSPKSPIPKEKSAKTVSCQTQIEGVNNILATFDHQNYPQPYMTHPYMNSHPMSFHSYQPWRPVNPMVLNWPHSSSF